MDDTCFYYVSYKIGIWERVSSSIEYFRLMEKVLNDKKDANFIWSETPISGIKHTSVLIPSGW